LILDKKNTCVLYSRLEESNKKSSKNKGVCNLNEGSRGAGTLGGSGSGGGRSGGRGSGRARRSRSRTRVGRNGKFGGVVTCLHCKDGRLERIFDIGYVVALFTILLYTNTDNSALLIGNDTSLKSIPIAINLATFRTIRARIILRILRNGVPNDREKHRHKHIGIVKSTIIGHANIASFIVVSLGITETSCITKIATEQVILFAINHLRDCKFWVLLVVKAIDIKSLINIVRND